MAEKRPMALDAPLARREYPSYKHYTRHQRSKLDTLTRLPDYHDRFRDALHERLRASGVAWRGLNVLCLGARSGAEVQAFLRCGAFAVGVDLNPGERNKFVVTGDFHRLAFATGSVDVIYTNSFDHARHPYQVLGEVHRLLKPGGRFIVEAMRGFKEGGKVGEWESYAWAAVDDLVDSITGDQFRQVERYPIEAPWPGEHLEFVEA